MKWLEIKGERGEGQWSRRVDVKEQAEGVVAD
jgi:hypothetical protein